MRSSKRDKEFIGMLKANLLDGLPPFVKCRFDNRIPVGIAGTAWKPAEKDEITMTIGTYGFDSIFDGSIFTLLESSFHERRHAEQFATNFECCGRFASEYRLNSIICSCSPTYYGMIDNGGGDMRPTDRYFHNIHEVDAEHYGIMTAYQYLSDNRFCPSVSDAETVILNNLNGLRRHVPGTPPTYVIDIDKPLASLDEFVELCDARLEKSMTEKADWKDILEDKDSVIGVVMNLDGFPKETVIDKLNSCRDGIEQRRIFAGICSVAHPEYVKGLNPEERAAINIRYDAVKAVFSKQEREKFNILPDKKRKKYYVRSIGKEDIAVEIAEEKEYEGREV